MASAWGGSWASAWGNSWGSIAAAVTISDSAGSGGRKRRRFEDEHDVWEYIEALKSQFAKAVTEQHVTPVSMDQPVLPEVLADAEVLADELRELHAEILVAKTAAKRLKVKLPDIAKFEKSVIAFIERAEEEEALIVYLTL